jgi:hypothetical protein
MKTTIKYEDWNRSSDGRFKTKTGKLSGGVQEYETDSPKGTITLTIQDRKQDKFGRGRKFTIMITPEILESFGYVQNS